MEVTLFFAFPTLLVECCVKILTFLDFLTICTLQTSIFVNIFCPIYASFVHSISGRVCFASLPDPRLASTKPPPALDHSIFIDYRGGRGGVWAIGESESFWLFCRFYTRTVDNRHSDHSWLLLMIPKAIPLIVVMKMKMKNRDEKV